MELQVVYIVCKNVCDYVVQFCKIMAAKTTIRISAEAHRILKLFAEQQGVSLVEALDAITQKWEREYFFRQMNQAYAAVREDAQAWEQEQEERRVWDNSLMDNLEGSLEDKDGTTET